MKNRKSIVYICIIALGLGYTGYSFLFGGNSTKAGSSRSTFVSNRRAISDSAGDSRSIKKTPKRTAEKKTIIKKTAKANKRSLKKRPGRRGSRKTKKKEMAPAA